MNKCYKTFQDLIFKPQSFLKGIQAILFFPNGYGIAVVRNACSLTTANTWEIAILKGTESYYDLCYDTPITDDVIGYCSEEKVSNIMKQIQDLSLYP